MNKVFFALLLITVLNFQLILSCGDDYSRDKLFAFNLPSLKSRLKRDASTNRKSCQSSSSNNRVDTSERVNKLREELRKRDLDAFLIPYGDSHQSGYISERDKRIKWISGFSGSSAFGVVTLDKAAFWTDGRYYIQAENELDCDWLFMKGDEGGDSGWIHWLGEELDTDSRIGADPTLTGAFEWLSWKEQIEKLNLNIVEVLDNPIDKIWNNRPVPSQDKLEIQEFKFSGRNWQDKIKDVREMLKETNSDSLIMTALDEISWLFNLKGSDVPFAPMFKAYAILSMDKIILYISPEKKTKNIMDHLNSQDCSNPNCVEIRNYEAIFYEIEDLSTKWGKILLGKKWGYSGGASWAIYNLIPENKIEFGISPVLLLKAKKNKIEIEGMKNSNIRDAVALIEMAQILEDDINDGKQWTELEVSHKLSKLRSQQKYSRGDSFETISAYAGNGAIIHYRPTESNKVLIGKDSLFLLDSGGQYLDGTTDVTRTFKYGQPTSFEKEMYTRVLMGSIDLANARFLKGATDRQLDILARHHLYNVGLNYRHGTGHGIGTYGYIHESPIQVRIYGKEDHKLEPGYTFSDEPGYYKEGHFGIRLETVILTVEAKDDYQHNEENYGSFYKFEPLCLVPFEPKLIDYDLLNESQIKWLNDYNLLIREKVGPELKAQNKYRAYDWMMERTEPLTLNSAMGHQGNHLFYYMLYVVIVYLVVGN